MSPEVIALVYFLSFAFVLATFFSIGCLVAKFKRRNKLKWGLAVVFGGFIPLIALLFLPRLPKDGDENVAEIRPGHRFTTSKGR